MLPWRKYRSTLESLGKISLDNSQLANTDILVIGVAIVSAWAAVKTDSVLLGDAVKYVRSELVSWPLRSRCLPLKLLNKSLSNFKQYFVQRILGVLVVFLERSKGNLVRIHITKIAADTPCSYLIISGAVEQRKIRFIDSSSWQIGTWLLVLQV